MKKKIFPIIGLKLLISVLIAINFPSCQPQGKESFFLDSKHPSQQDSRLPVVKSLVPSTLPFGDIADIYVSKGGEVVEITIDGENFSPFDRVIFGGIEKQISFVDSNRITFSLSFEDISDTALKFQIQASPGSFLYKRSAAVTVKTGSGRESNAMPFVIDGFIDMSMPKHITDVDKSFSGYLSDSAFYLLPFLYNSRYLLYQNWGQGNSIGFCRSLDGGESWENPQILSEHCEFNKPGFFSSDQNGFIYFVINEIKKKIDKLILYKSENGGYTWKKILIAKDSEQSADRKLLMVDANGILYLLAGRRSRLVLYVSEDQGETWSQEYEIIKVSSETWIDFAATFDNDNRFHILYRNTIYAEETVKNYPLYSIVVQTKGGIKAGQPVKLKLTKDFAPTYLESNLLIDSQEICHYFIETAYWDYDLNKYVEELVYLSFKTGSDRPIIEKTVSEDIRIINNGGIDANGVIWEVVKCYITHQQRWGWGILYSRDSGESFHLAPIPDVFSTIISNLEVDGSGCFHLAFATENGSKLSVYYTHSQIPE